MKLRWMAVVAVGLLAVPAWGAESAPAAAPAGKPVEKPALETKQQKESYSIGAGVGKMIRQQGVSVDVEVVIKGMKDALAGGPMLMNEQEILATMTALQTELHLKQVAAQKAAAEENKKAGEAFLAANKTKEGVVTLPSGLQYRILTAGTGKKPATTDTVECNYTGTLIDGTVFDFSKPGQPATFPVSGVIKGWTEALQLMPVGSKWQLFVPSDLAYGERGAGGKIPGNTTLVFEVELLAIK